ncbi:hypothetical protein [Nostoc sp.]|uniref:hypothetical protein n=1 Tax=Nostoc sp. TaxID=1180 RepID=UPI002FF138C7
MFVAHVNSPEFDLWEAIALVGLLWDVACIQMATYQRKRSHLKIISYCKSINLP